ADDVDGRWLRGMGHRSSWLARGQERDPFFARRSDWGGAHLTQAVCASVGWAPERAEAWKLDVAASLASDAPEARAAREAVDVLGDELRRSLAFYRTLAELPDSFTLRLSGGSARLAAA